MLWFILNKLKIKKKRGIIKISINWAENNLKL
jgi:hypothetical protein